MRACVAGGGEAAQSSGASSRMLGRPPVRVSPRERRPPPDSALDPMAHAEKAAVESAFTLMITSGLDGDPKSSATVASVGTPSGEVGSADITTQMPTSAWPIFPPKAVFCSTHDTLFDPAEKIEVSAHGKAASTDQPAPMTHEQGVGSTAWARPFKISAAIRGVFIN